MSKKILVVLFQLILSSLLFGQNFLSPVWKISFSDSVQGLPSQVETAHWQDVNLLLSWERQGYSWINGKGCIVNNFWVPDDLFGTDLRLTLSMPCNIGNIYVNGKLIGGNIPNQFWTNRDAKTEFILSDDYLLKGENKIAIQVSNLSYTGGITNYDCRIGPVDQDAKSKVAIDIPVKAHLYSDKDTHALDIQYLAAGDGKIKLSVVNDFHQSFVDKEFNIEKGSGSIRFNFDKIITVPGFYECVVIMDDGGYSSDVQWFTISPEKINCTNNTVPRFKEYWEKTLAELAQVPPEFNLIKVDSLCSESRDGYIAEMKSLGGLTIRGYCFIPKTPGKYAAVLHVPGYSYGWQELGVFLANSDKVIELALCVRGHGISADVFNPGFDTPGVWGYRLCSETENAYRAIYMDCVRAVEFLVGLPQTDASRIGVMGGSQGGGLTLVTAGLCNDKISACSYFDPFPCDTRDHLKIRTMCNTEISNYLNYYHDECSFDDALDIQDLLDTKGFAKWIKCPVLFTVSLFDDDSPPHLGFSAYNRISASKSYIVYPTLGHINDKTFKAQMQFLKDKLDF